MAQEQHPVGTGAGNRPHKQFSGFYQLNAIVIQRKDNNTESHSEPRGLNSLYGQRGAICAYFHWTWEYLTKGIAWAVVQRMLADQARYDDEESAGTGSGNNQFENGDMELTEDNADDFINYINSLT